MGSMLSMLPPPTLCSGGGGEFGGVFPVSEDFPSPPAHPHPINWLAGLRWEQGRGLHE